MNREEVLNLCTQMRLSAFQCYVIQENWYKYNLQRLIKQGGVLYAPYKCPKPRRLSDCFATLFHGPRADLIGEDKMLINDQRGIKVYTDGCFSGYKNGVKYYANTFGEQTNKNPFTFRII